MGFPQFVRVIVAPENARKKLYLNAVTSQLRTQLICILMMDNVKSQSAGTFKIEWPVVDKDALFRRAVRDYESNAENGPFRLARIDIAGAEENEKIAPQSKRFDAVLIQLEWFVVDRADKIFAGARGIREDGACIRIFFGLREHKVGELFTRKRTLAI